MFALHERRSNVLIGTGQLSSTKGRFPGSVHTLAFNAFIVYNSNGVFVEYICQNNMANEYVSHFSLYFCSKPTSVNIQDDSNWRNSYVSEKPNQRQKIHYEHTHSNKNEYAIAIPLEAKRNMTWLQVYYTQSFYIRTWCHVSWWTS